MLFPILDQLPKNSTLLSTNMIQQIVHIYYQQRIKRGKLFSIQTSLPLCAFRAQLVRYKIKLSKLSCRVLEKTDVNHQCVNRKFFKQQVKKLTFF